MAALFFAEMRFDPKDPQHPGSDRFVLSKGHAAPILYAAWAEAGAFDRSELLKLRDIDSDLEGHPTPRLPFVDVATGSLGQGICAAIGIALNARRIGSDYRTYCLLGDGESAEGSVWEAANVGAMDGLDNLCGITDVNGARPEPRRRCGSTTSTVRAALARVRLARHRHRRPRHERDSRRATPKRARTTGQPTMIVARTIKGKGVSFAKGRTAGTARRSRRARRSTVRSPSSKQQLVPVPADRSSLAEQIPKPRLVAAASAPPKPIAPPVYKLGDQVATREAYGTALAKLGEADARVVALDADVKNSTFSDKFEKALPDRFYQNFIAEQVMVGSAMGLAARGAIPFPSTFACFLTRAADFIRMAAISNVGIKLAGSHAGVSIGEDGPSQMALEDLAMCRAQPNFAVLYPCDAVSAERLVALMAYHPGPGVHADQPPEDAGDLRERRDVHDRRAEGAARERRRCGDGRRRRRDGVRGAEGVRPAEGRGRVRSA